MSIRSGKLARQFSQQLLAATIGLCLPTLRLLLGSDFYAAAEKSALEKIESDRHWKDLSLSTDYSSDETYI
jgi:hypothetical protein